MKRNTADSADDTRRRELRLDRLLGRQVLAVNNKPMGRLEEFRVEKHGRGLTVSEYVIGAAGLFERLGVGVNMLLGRGRVGGYVARWDQLDLTDPERPRLRCAVDELRRL